MASPVIQYDAAAGSDTAASGAGPAVAVTGASATNGSGNVVQLDGAPDLSGVADDGSAVLWADVAGTNRNLSAIVAVDNGAKTVTTEDLLSLGAGVAWAIGGKRQTLQHNTSRRDPLDGKPGWTWEFGDGNYDLSAELKPVGGSKAGGLVTFRAAGGASPVIRSTHNGPIFDTGNGFLRFRGLGGTTTLGAGSRAATMFCRASTSSGSGVLVIESCEIYGMAKAYESFFQDGCVTIEDCEIHDCDSHGVDVRFQMGSGACHLFCCNIHSNGGYGVRFLNRNVSEEAVVQSSRIWGNAGGGVYVECDDGRLSVVDSTIDGNTGDGLRLAMTVSNTFVVVLKNSAITRNTGYGVNNQTGAAIDSSVAFSNYNAFGLNTSGRTNATNGFPPGEHDVAVTADPWIDSDAGNFLPNADANGGALIRGAGTPENRDIGALQTPAASGGGGGPVIGCRFIQPVRTAA